jgi:hypothetical protein
MKNIYNLFATDVFSTNYKEAPTDDSAMIEFWNQKIDENRGLYGLVGISPKTKLKILGLICKMNNN